MKKHMICSECGHRILDVKGNAKGIIGVKCNKCKSTFEINLETLVLSIHTEKRINSHIIKCKGCNWRLFDVYGEAVGTIEIKCVKCGKKLRINLKTKEVEKIHTERIGA